MPSLTPRRTIWWSVISGDERYRRGRGTRERHLAQSQRKLSIKYHLHFASGLDSVSNVSGKPRPKRRSGCPVSISLEKFGDRWSLLIIRDLMVRGLRTFREFQESGEGISTNILAGRLRKLEASGIITAEEEKTDGRRVNYRLTRKG